MVRKAMVRKTMVECAVLLGLLVCVQPADAQWQTPTNSIPVGQGPGVTGFGSVGPCTSGYFVGGTGAGSAPTCQGYATASGATLSWPAKAGQIPALPDFGAIGNGVTDNSAAFAVAEASSKKMVYVPDGTFVVGFVGNLTKPYRGIGQIQDVFGDYVGSNFSHVTAPPYNSQGRTGGSTPIGDPFNADLSHVQPSYYSFDAAATPASLTAPYYTAATTPFYNTTLFHGGGSSGSLGRTTSAMLAGATVIPVNSTAGWASVGRVITFYDGETFVGTQYTITAFDATHITISPALAADLGNDAGVSPGPRTAQQTHYNSLYSAAAGDSYATINQIECGYQYLAGQTNVQFGQTCGVHGGSVVSDYDHQLLEISEYRIDDAGKDIAVLGNVLNLFRTNATGALEAMWVGDFITSPGTQPIDAGYVVKGRANTGLDTTGMFLGYFGNRAINMRAGQCIAFDSAQDTSLRYTYWGSIGGNSLLCYDVATSTVQLKNAGTWVWQATAAGGLSANAGFFTSGVFNNVFITAPAGFATFTLGAGKTLSVANSLTLSGTDGTAANFTGSTGKLLRYGASGWAATTLTFPDTTTANRLLYSSSANTVADLATANNGVLKTDGSGVPSISSTLPSGLSIPSPTLSGTVAGANTIPLSILAQSAANTVVGNFTGSTANVSANAMPSCSTAGSALSYTSGTGVGCNSSITAAAVPVGGITGLGSGVATFLATPSSANLAAAVTSAWTTYYPTITASSGSITSSTVNAARYQTLGGKTACYYIDVTVTTNGTGSGQLEATLPINAAALAFFIGPGVTAGTLVGLNGIINFASASKVSIVKLDGTYPAVDGWRGFISGCYQTI